MCSVWVVWVHKLKTKNLKQDQGMRILVMKWRYKWEKNEGTGFTNESMYTSIKGTCNFSVCISRNLRWLNKQVQKSTKEWYTTGFTSLRFSSVIKICWLYHYYLLIWRCLSNYDIRYMIYIYIYIYIYMIYVIYMIYMIYMIYIYIYIYDIYIYIENGL